MDKKTVKSLIYGFKYFPSPVSVMVAFLTASAGIIGYHSFISTDPPASFMASNVAAANDTILDKTVLMYQCDVTADRDTTIKVNRRVACDDNSQYDLRQSVLSINEGKNVSSRFIPLPEKHQSGTKCVFTSNIEWTPPLSVKPHFFETEAFPFVVDGVPQ